MESSVSIAFSRKQYESLLRILYLGEWMLGCDKLEKDKEIAEVEQLILSHHGQIGANHLVEYSMESGEHQPAPALEDLMFDAIDHYNEHTFWDEIAERMAQRDVIAEHGKKFFAMSEMQKITAFQPHIDRYQKEFEKNGLDNLVLNEKL